MGIKLLFFTGFSKFVAHESVAFMLVLFSCYSRCLLIFFWGGIRGWLGDFQLLSALWLLCIRF